MLYYNWQKHPSPPGPPFAAPSPNLLALLTYARANFGGSNLGIYVVRPITGGTSWSTHAYGAANDWGYTDYRAALLCIDFLIANHEALHVQMIIDENHDRTWKCWRDELGGPGWKTGTGVHGSWLHIETTLDGWADSTPIAGRLTVPAPAPITPTHKEPIMYLEWRAGKPDFTGFIFTGTHLSHATSSRVVAVALRGGATKVTVDDAELLDIIASSACTTVAPATLTPAMLAVWR